MEEWKQINERHFVSNYGRIKRIGLKGVETITYGSLDVYGYRRVTIDKKRVKVHRLVAKYFCEGYSDTLTVNHKDFNKENNHYENLECISAGENTLHYVKNKRKLHSSSSYFGVGFHKGIGKWTTSVSIDGKRCSVGVYDTDFEAMQAIEKWKVGEIQPKIGKGASNKGKCKYDEDFKIKSILIANLYGVRKAGRITKSGSSQITNWKLRYKQYVYRDCFIRRANVDNLTMDESLELAYDIIFKKHGIDLREGQFYKNQ